jgi:hypothetical protein
MPALSSAFWCRRGSVSGIATLKREQRTIQNNYRTNAKMVSANCGGFGGVRRTGKMVVWWGLVGKCTASLSSGRSLD